MRIGFLITGLLILLIANLMMMYVHQRDGFAPFDPSAPSSSSGVDQEGSEGFVSYFLQNAGASGMGQNAYEPIGAFDGVRVMPENGQSSWRGTAPNESLNGPEFQPGPDSLFLFKNNQVKPECCDASYSSDMGCVCTTPQQRNYINTRGGNRTVEDGI